MEKMKMKTKPVKTTRVELERRLREALAGQAYVYAHAERGVDKASTQHLMGSGVVMTLTVLGGREIFQPVLFLDGLSDETISAIKADLLRSYNLATLQKPRGAV